MSDYTYIGVARSTLEANFWFHLHPCPACGERDIGTPRRSRAQIQHGGRQFRGAVWHVTCPRCAHQRSVLIEYGPTYDDEVALGELGGPEPSTMIQPHELAAELARCSREIRTDITYQDDQERSRTGDLWTVALKCVNELGKFIPAGAPEVPAEAITSDEGRAYRADHADEFTRAYLDAQRTFWAMVVEALRDENGYRAMAVACGRAVLGTATLESPELAAAELARCSREIRTELRGLPLDELGYLNELWGSARRCVRYLLELLPEGAAEIPLEAFTTPEARAYRAAHRDQFTRAYLEERGEYFRSVREKFADERERRWVEPRFRRRVPIAPDHPDARNWKPEPKASDGVVTPKRLPLPPFSLASLAFHERWVAEGDGPERQQLIAHGVDARERKLSARDLSRAILETVTLDRSDLSFARLDGARLARVSAQGVALSHASLTNAVVADSRFPGSELTLANLFDSRFERCEFAGANLERTSWFRSHVIGCSFVGAVLVDAALDCVTFERCDFRGADFSIARPGFGGTTMKARFVECDLRDTNWQGRDLFRVEMIGCAMLGARGTPLLAETTIKAPDLAAPGEPPRIADASEVVRQWGLEPSALEPPREYRELVYDYPPDLASAVSDSLRARGIAFKTWVIDGPEKRHWFRIRDPLDAPVGPHLQEVMARYWSQPGRHAPSS